MHSLQTEGAGNELHVRLGHVLCHPVVLQLLLVISLCDCVHVGEGRAMCGTELAYERIFRLAVVNEGVQDACGDLELATHVEKVLLFFLLIPYEVAELQAALLKKRHDKALGKQD